MLIINVAHHQRCSLSSHHTALIIDPQSLLFINTVVAILCLSTSVAHPLHYSSIFTAATLPLDNTSSAILGDTSEDCHHHHHQGKV